MKRILSVCLLTLFLLGCDKPDKSMTEVLNFRERILHAGNCTFQAEIAADYGSDIYRFSVDCTADREGNIIFMITNPESISGISGGISAAGGQLTFNGAVLGFPLLANGELSPVSAPWIFFNSVRSGYLISCASDADGIRLTVNDSYEEDALQLDIWMKDSCVPYYAEILWRGRRILTLEVDNFEVL